MRTLGDLHDGPTDLRTPGALVQALSESSLQDNRFIWRSRSCWRSKCCVTSSMDHRWLLERLVSGNCVESGAHVAFGAAGFQLGCRSSNPCIDLRMPPDSTSKSTSVTRTHRPWMIFEAFDTKSQSGGVSMRRTIAPCATRSSRTLGVTAR
jgi:hypothetical protein